MTQYHSRGSTPVISVITPLYNAEAFVEQMLRSVSEQSFKDFEHIIVDDHSYDASSRILSAASKIDPRVRVISHAENKGVVEARNTGIKAATGRFLAFLDADDLWMADKLELQLEFMYHRGVCASFTDYRLISEDGSLVGRKFFGPNKIGWRLHHSTRFIGCSTVMLDRKKIGNFDFGSISPSFKAEDFFAWSNVIKKCGPIHRCPHDLVRYRVVANSRSSSGLSAAISVWKLYREIEKIPFASAALYFVCYVLFSCVKRRVFHPTEFCDGSEP